MSDYLLHAKNLADSLTAAGSVISDEELIESILDGLGPEYKEFTTAVHLRSSLSYDDCYDLLLQEEHLIKKMSTFSLSSSAAFTASSRRAGSSHSAHNGHRSFSSPHSFGQGNGRGRHWRSSHQNRQANWNPPRPHSSPSTDTRPPLLPTPSLPPKPPTFEYDGYCQLCEEYGHKARQCPTRGNFAYLATADSPSPTPWVVDSGATNHMTNDPSALTQIQPYTGTDTIVVGNGNHLPISHVGKSSISSLHGPLLLKDVLYVPAIKKNLLSLRRFCYDNHCFFEMDDRSFRVKDKKTGQLLLIGHNYGELYYIRATPHVTPKLVFYGERTTSDVWHARLGHPSTAIFHVLANKYHIPISGTLSSHNKCHVCPLGKACRLPFSSRTSMAPYPLDVLHLDVWGPAPIVSNFDYKYYLSMVDDYSRFVWLFPLVRKSDVMTTFVTFKRIIENRLNRTIKVLQTDGGGEFTSLAFRHFLRDHGITHQLSCPHTPQQNGIVERKHRHVTEMGLCLLAQSHLPQTFWVEAFTTAAFLINRLPLHNLGNVSPYEKLFAKVPDYRFLKTFGCTCFPHLVPYNKHKLMPKSIPCVFIGYDNNYKGYRCLDVASGKVYISRNVQFDELTFPYKDRRTISPPHEPSHQPLFLEPLMHAAAPASDPPPPHSPPTAIAAPTPTSPATPFQSSASTTASSPQPVPSPESTPPRKFGSINALTYDSPMHPLPHGLTAALEDPMSIEPTSYTQASKFPHWQQAMKEEHDALLQNHTWSLVPATPHMNIVGCKWVFRVKRKADGSIDRHKARLVAKGFNQQVGVDYDETFSPVVKPGTIRTILALAVSHNWSLQQLDVRNAFLNGILHEEVYMKQPPGFVDSDRSQYVCRLHKALYGLKQAPRAWFQRLASFLRTHGFSHSKSDASLFIYHSSTYSLYVLVYVDDLIVTGSNNDAIHRFIDTICTSFASRKLGDLHFFLGMEVTRRGRHLSLTQSRYASDLLRKFKMDQCKPSPTPFLSSLRLSAHDGDPLSDPDVYRSMVGGLQYLTLTRPDISFAVNQVCQYMHNPKSTHLQAVKRIYRYIKGTVEQGLLFHSSPDFSIQGFSDADWAGSIDDRRSTSGACIFLGPNLLTWTAKKQSTVSRSSSKAEYRALATTAAEIRWFCYLFRELGIPLRTPPCIFVDNVSTLHMAANPVFHARTRHIEIDYHFVRELLTQGVLQTRHISSHHQIADIFTKGLSRDRFSFLASKLNLHFVPFRLRGDDKSIESTTNLSTTSAVKP
ncbi:hypothetical protein ACFX1S_028273 [Malus domestica]